MKTRNKMSDTIFVHHVIYMTGFLKIDQDVKSLQGTLCSCHEGMNLNVHERVAKRGVVCFFTVAMLTYTHIYPFMSNIVIQFLHT